MFIDRDRVTAQLFNEGNRAAETFGATQWAYTSLEEIGSLIGQYQTLIYYPQYCYSPVLYWEVITKLLQTIFLIVLNKIIENVTPAVISDLKHLDNIVSVIIP